MTSAEVFPGVKNGLQQIGNQDEMTAPVFQDGKRIYDLLDVVEASGEPHTVKSESRFSSTPDQAVHELVDAVEDSPLLVFSEKELEDIVMKRVTEVTEKLIRELFPDIAERVILAEIEKIKSSDNETTQVMP